MSTARKILSNTFVQIAGKGAIAVIGLLTSKLLANYLMVEERGMYDLVYSVLAIVGIFADMGLYTIAIREISKDESRMEYVIGNILSIRNILAVTVVVLTLLGVFASSYLSSGTLSAPFFVGLGLASLSMIIGLLNGTITSVLQVKYDMTKATIAQVFGKVVIIGVMAISMFALFPKAMPGYETPTDFLPLQMLFFAGVVGNIVMYWYTARTAKQYTTLSYRFDWSYWKQLVRDALPYGLALVVATIYFKVDILILRFMYDDPSFAERQIGYYSAAVKIVEIFAVVPLFFLNALLPMLSKHIEEKGERLKQLISYSFEFLLMLGAPLVVGGVVLAYQIINATNSPAYLSRLGEGFVGSDMVLKVVIFTSLFSFLGLLFNFVLIAKNEQFKLIWINAACLLFNIVTNIIFIPHFGLLAAAGTTVVTEILVMLLTYLAVRKNLPKRSVSYFRSARILVSAGVMGLTVYLLKDVVVQTLGNDLGVLSLTLLGAVVYGGLLVLFRLVTKDMLRLLRRTA